MARNTVREQRPLAQELEDRAPDYGDGLVLRIEVSTPLSIKPVILNGHNVQHFELDLRCGGFTGELCILVSDDAELLSDERDQLLTMFRAPDLLKLRLTVVAQRLDEDINIAPLPLEVSALVTERALNEKVSRIGKSQLSFRRYFFRFADPAQVLWRQHFPLELFTQKSLRQVIEAHRNLYITMEYLDPELDVVKPMIFLGCDSEHRGSERASFYDLLMWRLDEMKKIWRYDYTRKVYQIYGPKPTPVAFDIIPHDVHDVLIYYPDYPRYQQNVLNDFVEQTQNRLIDNLKKVNLVRQDHLFNTEILREFESEVQSRTQAFTLPRSEFVMLYRRFPSKPYAPNVGVDFKLDTLDFDAEDIAIPFEAQTELCRVYRVLLRARTIENDVRPVYDGLVPANFRCQTAVWMELASDGELRLPPYILPRYPVPIEGRVVSEVGTPAEETYQFYPELLSRLPRYKVMIPLWANQIITTPYNPNTLPGQFYFPLYKYERVLVDMYYDKAFISQFREWRATAQLPLETQGDQLLLGKTPLNRTAVLHTYESERPVFEIERLNQFDAELVKIAEGNLLLQVGTPPVGAVTGTSVGRKVVLPLGLPAVPPRGSPPLPGLLGTSGLKPAAPAVSPLRSTPGQPAPSPLTPARNSPTAPAPARRSPAAPATPARNSPTVPATPPLSSPTVPATPPLNSPIVPSVPPLNSPTLPAVPPLNSPTLPAVPPLTTPTVPAVPPLNSPTVPSAAPASPAPSLPGTPTPSNGGS